MAKVKTSFFCQNCGAESPKWVGKCASCNEWNTYVEEVIDRPKSATPFSSSSSQRASKAHSLNEIEKKIERRIELKDVELNRVLGGGMVPGSLILFGGEPGIGKSTLLLQMAIQETDKKILYISGEESEQQIKMRADRIGIGNDNCFVLTETSMQNVFLQIEAVEPDILIIDSVQTMHSQNIESSPGSISQIRECTAELLRYAKESGTPVFLVGHITKEGSLAGPKVLEHMVDTVLVFEGDRNHVYRIIRSVKNRFGSTNELGIYEMHGAGLRVVENPSEILLSNNEENLSGISIASTLEGIRPIMVEVQALVSTAAYGTPQRSSTGYDLRRLNMLLAVLEKRCGFKLGAKDVFLNIAGGIKVNDPAIDLAVVCAIMSSNANIPINKKISLSAEISLSGEIKPVNRMDQRISEAQKLGMEQIIISKYNKGIHQKDFEIEIVKVGKIEDAIRAIFG
ncbi:DNA repair protein RadA [Paracrocinitomix mangrovi]|uniref:DNA repair protein RadA n=1 Tax=Paracrocinitomix mangrovi TaxID=2862509 RepID=UPI001C8EE3C4|nr:DNA repair protein RadA [Paracrocinitomix mangrovi]UKN00143.1 DNA repair protein RadA [Paracrocinitomix mangrovi]